MVVLFLAIPALLLVLVGAWLVTSWRATGSELDHLFATLAPAPTHVSPTASDRQRVLG